MKNSCFVFFVIATLFCACKPEIIELGKPVDVDGNTYDTVCIGTQTWMSQDLRVTHLPNGIALQGFDIRQTEPAYIEYGGKMLYNAMAAQYGAGSESELVQGICPNGWHLPSHAEWQQLIDHVTAHPEFWESSGSVSCALSSQQWSSSSEAANFNKTGFSALPTGYFISYGRHTEVFEQRWTQQGNAYYWSSDHNDDFPITITDTIQTPWIQPNWGWFGSDSMEVQSYVLLLTPDQDSPKISSLPDIHYCAIRCVKN